MKTETSGSTLGQAHKANKWGGSVTAKLWPPSYSSLSHWAVSKASQADGEGPFTVANIKSRQKWMGKNPRMLSWLELVPRKQRSAIRSFYHKNPPTQECPVSSHKWSNTSFILGKTCSNLLILKLAFSKISRYDCECRRTLSNHYWFLGIRSVPHASPGTPTTLIVILKVGICNFNQKRKPRSNR